MTKDNGDAERHKLGNGTLGPLENGFPEPNDSKVGIGGDLAEHDRKEKRIFGR